MSSKISIALCTYNGEKFLFQQLNSFLHQTILPLELVICDDCSTDRTMQILQKFCTEAPFEVKIYENLERLGPIKNFEKAISLCNGDYIALSDQDDVWLPIKLGVSLAAMNQVESENTEPFPILIHSDLKLIDANNIIVSESFYKKQKISPPVESMSGEKVISKLVVQNYVTGCTCFMNRRLLDLALPFPSGIGMHDWWLALVAASCGKIYGLSEPTVLYRQHSHNVIGAKGIFTFHTSTKIFCKKRWNNDLTILSQQVSALSRLKTENGYTVPEWMDSFVKNIGQSGLKPVWVILRYRILKQGWYRNIMFIMQVYLWKSERYEKNKYVVN